FFFSSRRRHTRFDCDWSSDVCSSDLIADTGKAAAYPRGQANSLQFAARERIAGPTEREIAEADLLQKAEPRGDFGQNGLSDWERSEERRVGKECRWRWGTEQEKENMG